MRASILDLRYRTRELMEALKRNEEVILTYRHQEYGRIVPVTHLAQRHRTAWHPLFRMLVRGASADPDRGAPLVTGDPTPPDSLKLPSTRPPYAPAAAGQTPERTRRSVDVDGADQPQGVLFATDVLVWCQRGSVRAAGAIDERTHRAISIVSWMELMQSVQTRYHRRFIAGFVRMFHVSVLPVSDRIGFRAAVYAEEYDMNPTDAFVAATAVERGLPLLTCDPERYTRIADLDRIFVAP